MRRASVFVVAIAVAAAPAFAHKHGKKGLGPQASGLGPEHGTNGSKDGGPVLDARGQLGAQLAAENAALATALGEVDAKLAAADQVRLARIRAAVRVVHAPAPGASEDDRLAAARRVAAARMLLARDAHERGLLADEDTRLRGDQARIAAAIAELASRTLPAEGSLARPVDGTISRHFGTYEHDRSHAQLSRRGLDFEVDDHAPVVAPADGIVRYAGPIRGLDRGAILDHGDYLTVVAKLGDVAVPVGAHVARGDHLGRAAHHRVYLEVRIKAGPGGLPVDPEPLLAH